VLGLNPFSSLPNLVGHDRQQLYMFYADLYTDTELVAFTDSDAVITTYVGMEMYTLIYNLY
jgi:hypothetical protein